jgi:nucleotide-binding universal stress UspA family protein
MEARMGPFTSVLCAVDFSEHSRQAVRVATAMAARSGAPLHLVHVIDLLLAEAAAVAYDEAHLLEAAAAELRAFAAPECAAVPPEAGPTLEIRIGRADREILHAAEARRASVIVLGTHGLGGFRKLFFGSVTERVLRKAVTPVLAVPLDQRRRPEPLTGGADSVLAAIDLDETALPMALAADQVAAALDAPLTLLHAVPPLQAYGPWAASFEREMPSRLERARTTLDHMAQVIGSMRRLPQVVVRSGPPAEEIADVAASMPNLLIVVGLGGGWMLRRPGTTAYRVLCLATAPVLALPPEAIAALSSAKETTRGAQL